MISLRTKIEIALGVILLVLASLGVSSWLDEHEGRVQAKATAAANQTTIDRNEAQMKAMADADLERDKHTADLVDKIQATAAAQQTPQQIVKWIPQQIPNLPAPIGIQAPPATAANPTPDAIATIPQEDLPIIRDDIAKCQECTVQLSGAQADLASKTEQVKTAGENLAAMTKERDGYKEALKGGTFFQRLKHNSKLLAAGAAAGAIAVCATGHCK